MTLHAPTDTPEALTRFLVLLDSYTREEIKRTVADSFPAFTDFDKAFENALAEKHENEDQLKVELDREAIAQEHCP